MGEKCNPLDFFSSQIHSHEIILNGELILVNSSDFEKNMFQLCISNPLGKQNLILQFVERFSVPSQKQARSLKFWIKVLSM